nr:ribonuclease H-like domain-containing protein [Tanacetum cinerariifolium]
KNSSRKEEVNITSFSTASTQVSPANADVATVTFSHDTILEKNWEKDYHTRAPRSQDKGRRENFKQGSKTEESAPKALMAIDGVGWDWSYMANEEENHTFVADEEALTEFALMAKSSSKNEVFDNSLCFKSCNKNTDSLNTKITELSEKLSDTKTNLYHYKLGLSQVEARLVEFKNQEIKFCEKISGLESKVESKDNRIERLTNELDELKKEKEGLDSKLTVDSPIVIKTNKHETVRKSSVKYDEMYRKTSKSFNNIIDDKGYWDSGCSRYMIGNISYLSDYEPYDGGYVSFGQGGGKITSKECIVLGRDFKLKDDTNVLLRTPRQHNMYSIDLNNIVPHKDLTCLVAKASTDESMLWHR